MKESLVAILGGVTRAYTLSILAGTRVPQTAYRVAKLAALSPPNVYVELRRLEKAEVVRKTPSGWLLVSEKVRALCEGSGPLFRRRFSLDLRGRSTSGGAKPLGGRHRDRMTPTRVAREPHILREFSRSATKNVLLRAAGLRQSRHHYR